MSLVTRVKDWLKYPKYKYLFTIYSSKAPFDNLDTEINVIGDYENDVLGLSNELFSALINQGREVLLYQLNGFTDGYGNIIYGLPIEELSKGDKIHEKFHREVALKGITSKTILALEEAMAMVVEDIKTDNNRLEYARTIRGYWNYVNNDIKKLNRIQLVGPEPENKNNSKWINLWSEAEYYLYYELCMAITKHKNYAGIFFESLKLAEADFKSGVEFLIDHEPDFERIYDFQHKPLNSKIKHLRNIGDKNLKLEFYTNEPSMEKLANSIVKSQSSYHLLL